MREQHRDKGSMNDDEECMESIAPVAEGTVPSGRGGLATIVEECCGKHAVSCGGKEAGRDARFRRISLRPVLSWMVYRRLIVTLSGGHHFDDLKHMRRPSLRVALIKWKDARRRKNADFACSEFSLHWHSNNPHVGV
jgi:hypothetical protein